MTAQWAAGTLYAPGSVVIPVTAIAPAVPTPIDNPGFESGDVDWTKGTGWTIENNVNRTYQGVWAAKYDPIGTAVIISDTAVPVVPGQVITAKCYVRQGDAGAGDAIGAVLVRWYTSGMVFISDSVGTYVTSSSGSTWKPSTGTVTAPATAAFASIGATATKTVNADLWVDSFSWDYAFNGQSATSGFIYKAVQAATALSGATEPVWPTALAGTVVDGGVTWEAAAANRVVWKAHKLLTSGGTEPVWPTEPGAVVADNTVTWECSVFHIDDVNCPNTPYVRILASKVFMGDDDVVRYCATLNARDWTTTNDAGFLPTGMNQIGEVGVKALGDYRGNLTVWNPSNFQMWQVDPDPALMSLLDKMPGIGSSQQGAVQSIGNDQVFLAALGVRSISIAAGAANLQAGDIGMPIDTLVQDMIANADYPSARTISTYYPSSGQYWLNIRAPALGLAVEKTADVGSFNEVGDVINYTYLITNGGDYEITGITVVDDKCGTLTPPQTTLAAGADMTINFEYTVTEEDIGADLTNVVTVSGLTYAATPVSAQDSLTIPYYAYAGFPHLFYMGSNNTSTLYRFGYGYFDPVLETFTVLATKQFSAWNAVNRGIVQNGNTVFGIVGYDNYNASGSQTSGLYAFEYDGTTTLATPHSWQISTSQFHEYWSLHKMSDGTLIVLAHDEDTNSTKIYHLSYSSVTGFTVEDTIDFGDNIDTNICLHNDYVIVYRYTAGVGYLYGYSVGGGTFTLESTYAPGAVLNSSGMMDSDGFRINLERSQLFDFDGVTFTNVFDGNVDSTDIRFDSTSIYHRASSATIKAFTPLDGIQTGSTMTFAASHDAFISMAMVTAPNLPDPYTGYQALIFIPSATGYATTHGGLYSFASGTYVRECDFVLPFPTFTPTGVAIEFVEPLLP